MAASESSAAASPGGMPSSHSVSCLLGPFKEGSEEAAQRLWNRFQHHWVETATRLLKAGGTRASETVAADAFSTLWERARDGRFPNLRNRDNLQALVYCIIRLGSWNYWGEAGRRRGARGGGPVDVPPGVVEQLRDLGLTPDLAAEGAETVGRLLGRLTERQRSVALGKEAGFANREIARQLHCSESTVVRELVTVRKKWQAEMAAESLR